jgi:hypothetical protein
MPNTFLRPRNRSTLRRLAGVLLPASISLSALFAFTAPARGQFIFGHRTSASVGTTEAPRVQDFDEGTTPVGGSTAQFEEQPGLNFWGSAVATSVVLVGPDIDEPTLQLDAIAYYDGPPEYVGFVASATAELTDGLIIHVPTTLPPVVEAVFQLTGGISYDEGSYGELLVELGTTNPEAGFSTLLDTVGLFNSTFKVALGLVPIGEQHEFNYAAGYTLAAFANARGGPVGSFAHVFFDHSVTILGFNVTDAAGNPLAATITSQSGTDYVVSPVPEPGGLAILAIAVASILAARRRSGRP